MRSTLVALLLAFAAACLAGACNRSVADGRTDGAEVYAEVCARCHGREGQPPSSMVARIGVKPLTSPRVQEQLSDEALRDQIVHGSDSGEMPAFGAALSDAQIDAVIDYVRSLDPPPTATSGR